MKRLLRFQIPLAAVALALSACGGSTQGTPACTTDDDCNSGKVCMNGACVPAAQSGGGAGGGSAGGSDAGAGGGSGGGSDAGSGGGSGGGGDAGSAGGSGGGSGGGASMAITDGDFESGLTGWASSGSTSVSSTSHSGSHAAQLGTTSGSGISSISQTFVAPANVAVSFWFLDVCTDTVDYAWAAASIYDNTAHTTIALLADTCTNAGAWVEVSSGALPVGHSLTLTLQSKQEPYQALYNYALFDDVTLIYAAPPPPDAGTDAGPGSDAGMDAGSDAGSLYNDGGPCGSTWTNYAANAFNVNCSSCHTGFSDYLDTKSDLSAIQQRIMSGSMPQGGWTNLADKQGILDWISCGAPE